MREEKTLSGCVVIFGMLLLIFSGTHQIWAQANHSMKPLNVIFVSSKIQNAQAIADAADKEAVAVVYDFENTTLRQINLTLEELVQWKGKKIDHLMFFCHGAPGTVILSAKEIVDVKSVKSESDEWKFFSKMFNKNATIDFYGSEIGWGEEGKQLVTFLSQVTGATVRASVNSSGNIHDADWNLEIKTGKNQIPCPINFSQLAKTPLYF
ncbi:MAG: DUF4347 domain-containing protein [Calditrichaeota bacterium]|nr:DUF4347 domain-containing protein [Calditrichota bacterium]